MNTKQPFPPFDDYFSDLNQFILKLVQAYEAGNIRSRDELAERMQSFFTPETMHQMEGLVPGWKKMASYAGGVTLVHVMCVFLGLFMLPEFKNLSSEQQQLAKWIVVFHDVAKEITAGTGERDKTHAFRSATITARQLPRLGFAVTEEYDDIVNSWSRLTDSATKASVDHGALIQDNQRLPEIFSGMDRMFGPNTGGDLIIKGVLLHMSINVVDDWPQAAPLQDEEITLFVNRYLAPLLKVVMLADNEGWSLFQPETRARQRNDTLRAFEDVEKLIT